MGGAGLGLALVSEIARQHNGLGKSGICLLHSVISVCIRISFVLFAIPVLGIRGYLYGILCSELALSILHSLQILQNNYSNPRK